MGKKREWCYNLLSYARKEGLLQKKKKKNYCLHSTTQWGGERITAFNPRSSKKKKGEEKNRRREEYLMFLWFFGQGGEGKKTDASCSRWEGTPRGGEKKGGGLNLTKKKRGGEGRTISLSFCPAEKRKKKRGKKG